MQESVFDRKKKEATKNGVLILVGAEKGTEVNPEKTALTIMKTMGVQRPIAATIYSLDTDHVPAREDIVALQKVREAAITLNDLSIKYSRTKL